MTAAAPERTPLPARPRGPSKLNLLGTSLGPLLALALVVVFFAVADWVKNGSSAFVSLDNIWMISVQTSIVAIGALGMTVVIITGGIDLSVGNALALSATVLAWCLRADFPSALCIVAGIGTGMLAGAINGILISTLRVVPFIITLGTMTIYLGLAKIVANETTLRPARAQVPDWLPALFARGDDSATSWLILAPGAWIALLLAVVLAAVLRYTVFGRHVFALGSNESTARLCGINVPRLKIAVYALSGLFIGLAGVYQFARLRAGNPTSGLGYELKIIAAVVIGGASLSGGRGSVLGTLAGAVMMSVIETGCTLLEVSNSIQDIVIGLIIIAAVSLDRWRERRLAA
jgi:ribose transport system permease protein